MTQLPLEIGNTDESEFHASAAYADFDDTVRTRKAIGGGRNYNPF